VDVVAAGGRAGLAYAHIRGGDPDFTVVMLDGVPLNDATDQLGGAVNLNTLPADTVERIEVVRGPLSAVYGATGLAGAINIITRRGTTDAPALSASLETGDADLIHGAFSISRGGEDRDFFVGVTWDEEEGRVGDESFEQFALQGNGSIPLGDNASLRLSGRVSTWDTLDYPEASGGPEADTELRDSEHTEVSLAGDLRIGGGRRDHALYLRVLRHDTERTTPGFAPGAGVLEQVEDQTYVNATLGWSVPLIERSERRLIVGAELGWEDGENDATFGGGPVPFELDRKTVGAFVEFVSQSGPLQWEVAARLDDPEDEDLFFSPRASLAYRPGDGRTTLRASAGRAFDLPSFFALATPLGGNPELESEIALGGDLGVAHTFLDGMFDASLELFYVTYDELIDFLLPPEVPPENIGFVNRDEVTTQGAELQVTCKPHPRFEVAANVTYQDTEIEGTDEKLRQRPEWIGGLRIHWRPIDALSWQVDAQGVSEMADASLVITDRFETEGFEIFGSALSYDIARQWQLRARVDNILDEEYETFIGFPGPGRSYRVGLRFHTR
ncbi:MAG: TonB-dependent receptor, partial [bacterium]|nr:TonB-dependent receptor [bacterium]